MNKRTDTKTLWKLFLSTLYISTFTFGGGFVIVTFMKQKFVDELHWLKEDEMLDFAAFQEIFVTDLLLVQSYFYYFSSAIVSLS